MSSYDRDATWMRHAPCAGTGATLCSARGGAGGAVVVKDDALVHARIKRLVYGAPEPKAGVVGSHGNYLDNDYLNHRVEVSSGILGEQSSKLISGFLSRRRAAKKSTG